MIEELKIPIPASAIEYTDPTITSGVRAYNEFRGTGGIMCSKCK